MPWHKEIWSYLVVTLVAVLIWAWAASETRERRTLPTARVLFVVEEPSEWIIRPSSSAVPSVNVEGTKLSVQKVSEVFHKPISIPIPVKANRITINLAERLRENEDIIRSGARIISTDPTNVELELDSIERVQAPVKPVLTGVTPEGEITIEPPEVTMSLPHSLLQRLPQDFAVEAFVDRSELDLLEPGVPQSMDVRVRMPETIRNAGEVRLSPASVKVQFTIRSRIRETTVESMRVQIASPPEERDHFVMDIEPRILRDVTVLANADLSRQIESGEVQVVAVVHLSSLERAALIERKAISYFLALVPQMGGGPQYVQLASRSGEDMPTIAFRIAVAATHPSTAPAATSPASDLTSTRPAEETATPD